MKVPKWVKWAALVAIAAAIVFFVNRALARATTPKSMAKKAPSGGAMSAEPAGTVSIGEGSVTNVTGDARARTTSGDVLTSSDFLSPGGDLPAGL